MTNTVLLAVCAILIGFGILVIVVSSGFFMNLLGAGAMALGASAAYLILSPSNAQPGNASSPHWGRFFAWNHDGKGVQRTNEGSPARWQLKEAAN